MEERDERQWAARAATAADQQFGDRFDLRPQLGVLMSADDLLEFVAIDEPAESSVELLDKPDSPPVAVVVSALGHVSSSAGERTRARVTVGVSRQEVMAIVRWRDGNAVRTPGVDGPLVDVICTWAEFRPPDRLAHARQERQD